MALGLLVCVTLAVAWAPFTPKNDHPEAVANEFLAPAPNILAYTWDLDTITNAANDTLVLPWSIQSRYTGALQVTRTNISGTTALAVSLQASVTNSSSTDVTWVQVAATSGTGATAELLTLSELYGQRYRVIIDGSGTQSSSYRISFLGKKYQ